jgi:hypothetical protein
MTSRSVKPGFEGSTAITTSSGTRGRTCIAVAPGRRQILTTATAFRLKPEATLTARSADEHGADHALRPLGRQQRRQMCGGILAKEHEPPGIDAELGGRGSG